MLKAYTHASLERDSIFKRDIKTKFPRYKDEIPNVLFQLWLSFPISFPEQISEAHGVNEIWLT